MNNGDFRENGLFFNRGRNLLFRRAYLRKNQK